MHRAHSRSQHNSSQQPQRVAVEVVSRVSVPSFNIWKWNAISYTLWNTSETQNSASAKTSAENLCEVLQEGDSCQNSFSTEHECIYSQTHSHKAQMSCPVVPLSSSLVTISAFSASLLPPPVWFYAFDPRGTSRFTFLAFRPQSLLGYLLSPPALSTIISQQERTAATRPGGGRWDTFDSKKLTDLVELLWILLTRSRTTFRYDESVSW